MKNVDSPAFLCRSSMLYPAALLAILMLALFTLPVSANTVWCGPVATGNGSGSDSNDLESIASVNNSWPVSAGGQLNLCGTFTNINQELLVGASGTAGNPITIYFEPGAQFVGPYWPSSQEGGSVGGAITIVSQNYITIDGGQNGLIEATQNGSGLKYQVQSTGVGAGSASFLTVKNLRILGMYVRSSTSDEAPSGSAGGTGVADDCATPPYGITNYIVTNCIITDAYTGIDADYGVGKNYIFIGNTISRCNWGGRCGDRDSSSTMNNLVVANNNLSNWTNWDDPANDDFHHNGFFGWAVSGGSLLSAVEYGNRIGPNYGGAYSTSGLYFQGNCANMTIYNNVFICNPNDGPANGMITIGYNQGFGPYFIANNTFLGGGTSTGIEVGGDGNTNHVYNNLGENCTFIVDNYGDNCVQVTDYNFGYNLIPTEEYAFGDNGTYSFDSPSQWFAHGFDAHGSASINPLLNSDGTLQAGSPVASSGTNLSSYFNTDIIGNPRPATGNWTVGAYQVESGAPIVSLTAAPTNSTVTMTNPGSLSVPPLVATLTWSSANATSATLSGYGTVPLTGSTNASPSQTTNYTLTAISANGSNSASVTVVVPTPPTNLNVK